MIASFGIPDYDDVSAVWVLLNHCSMDQTTLSSGNKWAETSPNAKATASAAAAGIQGAENRFNKVMVLCRIPCRNSHGPAAIPCRLRDQYVVREGKKIWIAGWLPNELITFPVTA